MQGTAKPRNGRYQLQPRLRLNITDPAQPINNSRAVQPRTKVRFSRTYSIASRGQCNQRCSSVGMADEGRPASGDDSPSRAGELVTLGVRLCTAGVAALPNKPDGGVCNASTSGGRGRPCGRPGGDCVGRTPALADPPREARSLNCTPAVGCCISTSISMVRESLSWAPARPPVTGSGAGASFLKSDAEGASVEGAATAANEISKQETSPSRVHGKWRMSSWRNGANAFVKRTAADAKEERRFKSPATPVRGVQAECTCSRVYPEIQLCTMYIMLTTGSSRIGRWL